ncbi:hypothetical protein V6N13_108516 [Hibiscus sabdariffa]
MKLPKGTEEKESKNYLFCSDDLSSPTGEISLDGLEKIVGRKAIANSRMFSSNDPEGSVTVQPPTEK